MMQDARIVPERHLVAAELPARAGFQEHLARLEDLGDEHGAFALRRRRQEVQVLPHRAADRARDADIVLEPGVTLPDSREDELLHDRAALGPQLRSVEPARARSGPDHDPAKAAVTDEDVRPQAQDEPGDSGIAAGDHGVCEIVGRRGIVQDVRRTANPEGGVRSQRDVPPEAGSVKPPRRQRHESVQGIAMICHQRTKKASQHGTSPA